jgi:hypothetical protein
MPNTNPAQLDADTPVLPAQEAPQAEITDKQKEAFFKAFLADQPYEEEFTLLGGNYRVTLKALSMKENNDLLTQIAYDRDKGRITGVNDYYFARVAHYRLALSLVKVNDKPFGDDLNDKTSPPDREEGITYVARRADLFASWQMVKMAALQTALKDFDQRVLALVDAIANPDFWKAGA